MADAPAAHEPYDAQYFSATFAVEDTHFWFRARNELIEHVARRVWTQRGGGPGRILEVGCGTGNVLRILERSCPGATVVGMELFPEGLRFARSRTSVPLVCARVEALPFAKPFEMIGLFDVLEHIPDDSGALTHLHAQLDPGGMLLLTVPAYQRLWSRFDEASGHARRYSPPSLETVLARAGFVVEFMSPFMLPLLPAVWLMRHLSAWRRPSADPIMRELSVPAALNAVLLRTLRLEQPWISGWRTLPFGTSILAVARKG